MIKDYNGIQIHITNRRVQKYYFGYFFIGTAKYNQYGLTKIEVIRKAKQAIEDIIRLGWW